MIMAELPPLAPMALVVLMPLAPPDKEDPHKTQGVSMVMISTQGGS